MVTSTVFTREKFRVCVENMNKHDLCGFDVSTSFEITREVSATNTVR